MADAYCGPSNPLQNLQKHTQVDRTLQQDRLVGNRQSPSQGFRTADPRVGTLDGDFHAFETSAPNPFQLQQPEFVNGPPLFHPQALPSAPGGWAADFQRLSLDQSPVPVGQFRAEAPLIKSATPGGWQNEFMRQRSGVATPVSLGKQKQVVLDPPNMDMNTFHSPMSMMTGPQPMYQAYNDGFQQQQPQQGPAMGMEQNAQISDVDFEAAFADAFAHAQEMDQYRAEQAEIQQPAMEENLRIGSDAIAYREKTERTADQDTRDADELARTAGQLLNSVSHDTSDKFQNSQFLQLMRKIRDREVEVKDEDLKDTATSRPAMESQGQSHFGPSSQEESSHFEFPDMDAVYAPTNTSDVWSEQEEVLQQEDTRWSSARRNQQHPPYTTYGFDDDQYPTGPSASSSYQPLSQIEALHPGGRFYPEQSPRLERAEIDTSSSDNAEMSGAVPVPPAPVLDGRGGPSGMGGGNGVEDGATLEKRISASDFEYVDESAGLARRFVRPDLGL